MTYAATPARGKTAKRGTPSLDISGPRILGLAAATALAALITAAAAVTVPTGTMTTARGRLQAEPISLRHADGGVITRVFVKNGADVEAGALIATLDTRLIDNQIAGLKRQMDGIQLHVSGLKQEAEALAASERQSASRQRLAGLEAQIATFEQEGLGLEVRLAMAEQERNRTEMRAPLRGRLTKLVVAEMASVPVNGVIAEIQPAADRLVLEAVWPAVEARSVVQGQPVAVWLGRVAPWSPPLNGRVEQVLTETKPTGASRVRLRISAELSDTDLAKADRLAGELDFSLQLVSGASSLLSLFVAPLFSTPSIRPSPEEKVQQ